MTSHGGERGAAARHTARTWLGLAVLGLGVAVTLLNLAVLRPLPRAIGTEVGTTDATTGQLATAGARELFPDALWRHRAIGILVPATTLAFVLGMPAITLLLAGERTHPGAVMSVASASIGIENALGPVVTGAALAVSGSHEVGYRALGLLAPIAVSALWLGTRQRGIRPPRQRKAPLG